MVTTRSKTTTKAGPPDKATMSGGLNGAAGKKRDSPTKDTDEAKAEKAPDKRTKTKKTAPKSDIKNKSKKQPTIEEALDEVDAKKDSSKDEPMPDAPPTKADDEAGEQAKSEEKASAVSIDPEREKRTEESPILEKGLVYFFTRSKVDVEEPQGLDDVKRSYMVLRPLPLGAKLEEQKLEDGGENRLLVIPKKRLPSKGHERFLTYVEAPKESVQGLKENYLHGRTYETKTKGERHDFPAQPVGEGVYAITKTDNERQSHLAYILTVPETPKELQIELGLQQKGSFVVSARNPNTPAPANVGIPAPAEYPKEIMDEFRGLRWGALKPHHLQYKHAEVLFIGEKSFPSEGEHKGTGEELDELEEEDKERVEHLKGDEAVFQDLELSKEEYKGIKSGW